MDRAIKTVLIGGGLLLAYNMFSRKVAAATLNFLPGQLKRLSTDGATPVLTIGVIIQNTSNQSYQLNSLAGNVYANNDGNVYNVGNVSTFTVQQILPNRQQEIVVDMRLSLTGIVSDLLNSIANGFGQDIQFKGYANVDGLQIPIVINYKL